MKYFLPVFVVVLSVLGAAIPDSNNTFPAGYNHYATFIDPVDGFTFTLHSNDYHGPPLSVILNSTESNLRDDSSHVPDGLDTRVVDNRDVCRKVTMCLQKAVDSTTTGAIFLANISINRCKSISGSITHYFTENNYANLNSILQNAVVGLAVNIASAPIGNAVVNSEHSVQGQKRSDACDLRDKQFLAEEYGAAVGEFCAAIQRAQSTDTETHFYAGDVSSSNLYQRQGEMATTKAFVAAQAGNFGPICSAMGITWKRRLGFA